MSTGAPTNSNAEVAMTPAPVAQRAQFRRIPPAALPFPVVFDTTTVSATMLVAVSTLVAFVPSLITPMCNGSGLFRLV